MSLHRKKAIILLICCVLTLMSVVSPLEARADRSRAWTIGLFATGMGLKFGSVFVENSAQDSYDQYLHTAIQSDIAKHRDSYTAKHNASTIMSRVGMGLVGIAALISVFDQLDFIATPSTALRLTPSYNLATRETTFRLRYQF